MTKTYRHLFFDLDHTLWDFEANSKLTLHEMFNRHRLHKSTGVGPEDFYEKYIHVNNQKWALYREGKITKKDLRAQRFPDTFRSFGIDDREFSHGFEREYMDICPNQTKLIPGAEEVLEYLRHHYELHIITNGFIESQDTKLSKSGIDQYFIQVISSEEIGVNKPAPQIFEESLKRAGATAFESLMIGDSLEADVIGAKQSGLDQVYYNPLKLPHGEKPTFEVDHLLQLKSFL